LIEDALTMNTYASNNVKSIVQPISLPTPVIQDMAKQVYVTSYKVDYKVGTRYFTSSVEGEAFMRQLNNDYQKNMIPNPGNVNGYYTITLVQGLVDYGRWNTKALQIN
jgi:zona occludens toxin (predicted ATPase)